MVKVNCWQFKKCGRQQDGANAAELGVCPAAIEEAVEGVNCGKKGGRACWALAGTLCGGKVQGTFASKITNCMHCDFYQLVRNEEGKDFIQSREILARLGKRKKG